MVELVPANPKRKGLWVQNVEDVIFSIYARKDNPYGGMYVYSRQWLYFEKQDSPADQWFVKTPSGTAAIRVVEFY